MTDHEMLEMAAKAAGLTMYEHVHGLIVTGSPETQGVDYEFWNPLTDDGDALRLAVKLRIDLEWREDGRIAAYRHAHADGHCFTAIESSREDCAAAARRAIVRAAAEIGRAME